MRWNITNKLFLIFLLGSLLLLALSALLARWSFERGFLDYVNGQEYRQMARLADPIAEIYRHTGSLEALRDDPRLWRSLARKRRPDDWRRPPGPGPSQREPHQRADGPRGKDKLRRERVDCLDPVNTEHPQCKHAGERRSRSPRRRPPDPLRILPRTALFDAAGERIVGNPMAALSPNRLAIRVDDAVVGELRIEPLRELTQAIDVQFARRQSSSLIYIAIGLLVFSGIAALLVARLFTRPLKALMAGSQRIAGGVYDQPIVVNNSDELGELAGSFNTVGETLKKNRDARQRWLADISHELRTPLAILTGELQAIEDGVRKMDGATNQSLQAEVLRLNQLVGDLHELSLSDEGGPGYRRDHFDVAALLADVLSASRGRLADAGITLTKSLPPNGANVIGDSQRLSQLFINLVENSLRYTDQPGQLSVTCKRGRDDVEIIFADSPPGVPAKSLPYIFERLYRVDESRSRQTGGSGLGLAICEGIVQAHHGKIHASTSHLGGLAVHVTLPLAADTGE